MSWSKIVLNKSTIELTNHQFLTNKEWWIEEKDSKYFLFVKHNGKTYQSSVDKDRINYAKESNLNILKEGWTSILINRIELQIAYEELDGLKT